MIIESELNQFRAIMREELARMLMKREHLGITEQIATELRAVVREELERIVEEQTRELDALFKPPPKHDGKLLDDDPQIMQYVQYRDNEQGRRFVAVRYAESAGLDDIWFSPRQALSLRDWLNQEMPTLEHLTKEQKE